MMMMMMMQTLRKTMLLLLLLMMMIVLLSGSSPPGCPGSASRSSRRWRATPLMRPTLVMPRNGPGRLRCVLVRLVARVGEPGISVIMLVMVAMLLLLLLLLQQLLILVRLFLEQVGKAADVVILDRDLFALESHLVSTAQMAMTIIQGRIVYQRPGEQGAGPVEGPLG
jgi:hypothetical protein